MTTDFFMEDAIIIQELVKHNDDAFEWLVEKYYTRMVAHAHAVLRDEAEAKDVIQELLMKLLEFKGWHKVIDLRSYVIRAAHNIALHRIEELKRISAHKVDYIKTVQNTWIDITPLQLMRDELSIQHKINYFLSLLSPQRKEVFKLVYLEGHSYSEAAQIMGVAKNTVKTHLKLGMKVLRSTIRILILLAGLMS